MAASLIRYIFVLALMIGAFTPSWVAADTKEKFVRVAILDNIDELEFSLRGKYTITDIDSGEVLQEGRSSKKFALSSPPSGIQINDEIYRQHRLRLTAAKEITFHLKNKLRRYRGSLDVIQKPNKKFLIVNVIELEQYIKGVLYHEISHRWPMDAMKAQAVAARTYAVYQMKKNKDQLYDVTGDIYSQVYGGKSAERFRTNIAVKRTQGEILVYADKIVPAYFHASCGGHTENAKNIWGEDIPPLQGVPCPFCVSLAHYSWKKNYRSKDIQEKLNQHNYSIGPIKEIQVSGRNKSGRINNLVLISRDGIKTTIPGIKFRELIGPNVIKSNKYAVEMKGYYFDLIGNGWGHGVGMCQWGAYGMAEDRYSYKDILTFYYPESQIVDYRKNPPHDLP